MGSVHSTMHFSCLTDIVAVFHEKKMTMYKVNDSDNNANNNVDI